MRAVNVIQHDDAGPSTPGIQEEEEQETVELPPAYTNLKKPRATAGVAQPSANAVAEAQADEHEAAERDAAAARAYLSEGRPSTDVGA